MPASKNPPATLFIFYIMSTVCGSGTDGHSAGLRQVEDHQGRLCPVTLGTARDLWSGANAACARSGQCATGNGSRGRLNALVGWFLKRNSGRATMKIPRRRFLHLTASIAALPLSRLAMAQAYPTRPVRLIVPVAAGGPTDIVARLIGQWLSERLHQPFIVENRSGAGSASALWWRSSGRLPTPLRRAPANMCSRSRRAC